MGGYGSGRLWDSTRQTVESGLTLSGYYLIPIALKCKGDNPGYSGTLTWSRRGEPFANIGYQLWGQTFIFDYSRNREPISPYSVQIIPTNQPKGGLRYWFLCPLHGCNRRVAKLYLPNGAKYFGCRTCYNLTYESCNESHKWDGLYRLLAGDTGYSIQTVKASLKRLKKS